MKNAIVKASVAQRKLQIVLKLLGEKKAVLFCIYVKAVQNYLMIHYVTLIKRHWSNRLDQSAPMSAIYSQANDPGDHEMADTSHISNNLQNKSSAENTEQIDIDSIEWKNDEDNICPQCGQNHGYKLIAEHYTRYDFIS